MWKEKWNIDTIVLILLLFVYLLTKEAIVGLLTAVYILFAFFYDFFEGVKKHGWKEEIKALASFIGLLVVIYIGSCMILQTSTPFTAVVTCSMKPFFSRGDITVIGKLHYNGEIFECSSSERAVYKEGKKLNVTSIVLYCMINRNTSLCKEFFTHPEKFEEKYWCAVFKFGKCKRGNESVICTKEVYVNGKKIENRGQSVIAYRPMPGDTFYPLGIVIHRAIFAIKKENEIFFFTLGDNNEFLDVQLGNSPIPEERVFGEVKFIIPYLGYYRVFLGGFVEEGKNCRELLQR